MALNIQSAFSVLFFDIKRYSAIKERKKREEMYVVAKACIDNNLYLNGATLP